MRASAIKRVTTVGVAAAAVVAMAGCEWNGVSSSAISKDILRTVERICGENRDARPRGGVQNIMLMEGREDDGIVTCHDGTNHYFDA